MNFLLRLKSWQLFLLLIVPYFLTSIPYFGNLFYITGIVMYVGWPYAIGTRMHALMPDKLKPGITLFKYCCIILIVIIITLNTWQVYFGGTTFLSRYQVSDFVILPILLFLIFYIWMFAPRMLESVIEGRMVYRSDSLRAFFGFWFFPIGVWYIQPIVHRVLDKYR
ncbi:MAG TPA: hypothetical protein VK668_01275 [Mucilaginibacter sp.]|nr:hypothetical protein [Mucilaginibacter sp.]